MTWTGDKVSSPQAEWVEGQPGQDKIKTVLAPCLDQLNIGCVQDFDVEYFSEGSWNKVFLLANKKKDTEYIFRVCLPIYPWYKTESEVATMEFVRQHTDIPVPIVYAFESSADNELGYEWILMQKLPGVQYCKVDDELDMDSRLSIARKIADWVHQLSQHRFTDIGSLYFSDTKHTHGEDEREGTEKDKGEDTFKLGRLVNQYYMGDWRHDYQHERGPFNNVHDFLRSYHDCRAMELCDHRQRLRATLLAIYEQLHPWREDQKTKDDAEKSRLKLLEADYDRILASRCVTENASVDFETCRYGLSSCKNGEGYNGFVRDMKVQARLMWLVDTVSSKPFDTKDTFLHHWDISSYNLLVDEKTHEPTGLLDWEQIFTLPPCLIGTRHPPLMARDLDDPDASRLDISEEETKDENGEEPEDKCWTLYCWERQKMREEFDSHLRHLNSPWLEAGKDSKDESPRRCEPMDLDDCENDEYTSWGHCRDCNGAPHHISEENKVLELYEHAQSIRHCNVRIQMLEDLENARDKERHCVWLRK